MAGELMCCLFCGRDTRSKSGACARCEGRKSFGLPASHYDAISNKSAPKSCEICGREFRGDRRCCDECRGLTQEIAYHGDNYGEDDLGR